MLNILPPLVVAMEIRLSYVIMCVYHALKVFHDIFLFLFLFHYFLASRATLHVRLLSIHIENQGLLFFFFFALGGAPSHRHVQYKVMCIIYIKEYHSIEEKRKKRLCVLIYI